MRITRIRDKLLLGAIVLSTVVALSSMLAVSWVIGQQYLAQSNALLRKSSAVINDNLAAGKNDLLAASGQLAGQPNIGSTIWYLAQYAQSDVDPETLFGTYQQLAKDILRIGRAVKLSRIAVYDPAGNLVSFALFGGGSAQVGFVERLPAPLFRVATLKDGEELNRQNLRTTRALARISFKLAGQLPLRASAHYAEVDGRLAIESQVPIMGETFDPVSGKRETRQLGLVVTARPLDQSFIDRLSRMADIRINIFTPRGLSSGEIAAYRNPDWSGVPAEAGARTRAISFNEIAIAGTDYYQGLMPLYTGRQLVGTIAILQSKEHVRKNILEMVMILGLIALASLLVIVPFAWHFTASISHPLSTLTHIFRGIAGGQPTSELSEELDQLEKEKKRDDELGDLATSFGMMADAVQAHSQAMEEQNRSLESRVAERTRELGQQNKSLQDEIEKRVETEHALLLAEQRFSKAFLASPFIMTISELETGRYVEVNVAFLSLLGLEREAVIGRSSLELGVWESEAERNVILDALRREDRVRHLKVAVRGRQGQRHILEIGAERLEVGGKELLLIVAQDVTESIALQEALQRSRDQLEVRVAERTRVLAETTSKLEGEVQTRKDLERHLLEISEEEQARIGRELHDDIGQLLTGAAYLVGALSNRLAKKDPESSRQAKEILDVVQDAISRTRHLSHGLFIFNATSQGLAEGLERLADDVARFSGTPCRFDWNGDARIDDPTIATHLYRIAQEAANNAIKHSRAQELSIDLRSDANLVRMTISDDGVGIPMDAEKNGRSMGLMSMNFRAQLIGAALTVAPREPSGTRITATLESPPAPPWRTAER